MTIFKVGDRLRVRDDSRMCSLGSTLWRHRGVEGQVIDLRAYGSDHPTHYVVKFDCYKIPHTYMTFIIETECEPLTDNNNNQSKQQIMAQKIGKFDIIFKCQHGKYTLEECSEFPTKEKIEETLTALDEVGCGKCLTIQINLR